MTRPNVINRNKIYARCGEQWLTVPVSFKLGDRICDTRVASDEWADAHLKVLREFYAKSPYFEEVLSALAPVYEAEQRNLADLNITVTKAILSYLGIERKLYRSSELNVGGRLDDRAIGLVKAVGGTVYVSGAGGARYQDPAKFAAAGLGLEVKEYRQIAYPRNGEPFVPNLSILDALFWRGRGAVAILRYPCDDNPLDGQPRES